MEISGGSAVQGWIRSLTILLTPTRCFALTLLLGIGPLALAETGHPELDLGVARFALDTGRYAEALRYTNNPETENESLIHAKALLNTGRQKEAVALLDRLVGGDYHRGEAALLKSGVMGGDPEGQQRLLELASRKGHGTVRQQAFYQLAEMARTDEKPEKAGQILSAMDPGYWAALGYMNMAADYGKRDLNPSRALISLRVALAMAEEDTDRKRGEALKAQLLVRAGLLAYESSDYDKAISF
jgi:tetratricopeptide (TPR) repeat protein